MRTHDGGTHEDRPAARRPSQSTGQQGQLRAPSPKVAQILGLQQTVGNAAVAQLLTAQRYEESTPVRGMGSGIGNSTVKFSYTYATVDALGSTGELAGGGSMLNFEGGLIETVTLDENATSGRVSFHTFEQADINNLLLDDRQWDSTDCTVPFDVVNGAVSFQAPIIQAKPEGTGATMTLTVGNGVTPGGGYVAFTATVAASGSQTTGGSIGVGPISASAPISGTSNFAGGLARTFTVNLRMTPAKPVPGPDMAFRVNSAKLAEGQEGTLANWFLGLPPGVQDGIRNGRRSVTVTGYASTTGRRKSNRALSEQRAHVAEGILRGYAGSAAVINVFFFGKDATTTPDQLENELWRKATIVVQAPGATQPAVPTPP
jgi:hypothetical protein